MQLYFKTDLGVNIFLSGRFSVYFMINLLLQNFTETVIEK